MLAPTFYAHTLEGQGPESWQPLAEHLGNVADMAASFASEFGFGPWAYGLGLLHDAGKVDPAFQRRLFEEHAPSFDHAIPGAKLAQETYRELAGIPGRLMAYAIAGHHGGMPNGGKIGQGESNRYGKASLKTRMERMSQNDDEESYLACLREAGLELPDSDSLSQLPLQEVPKDLVKFERGVFSTSFLTRMLFSCLVDADYLDTEAFMTPEAAKARGSVRHGSIGELADKLDDYMEGFQRKAGQSTVNVMRARVLACCKQAASREPGFFSLTVPTGGGKTLSSLAFALHHAQVHGKRRIIYAIPFTSIVEQTASTFRKVLGDDNVLEHHSNYDFDALDEERRIKERLAIQNWDAPVVVTTNVQLFESLFSNKPSRCRKLHNIANSVIVLDEAQTLPDSLLTVSLAAMEELVDDCGASIVLCTATQPALDGQWPFHAQVREIATCQKELGEAFGGRTSFVIDGEIDRSELAQTLATSGRALCVIGTKPKARDLYRSVVEEACAVGHIEGSAPCDSGFFHLSTNMTPIHRSEMLDEIRRRLKVGERCVVVSTQLIEAGVDVDFPVVYREIAGIDSMIQAAGRCNREGRRDEGLVHVFELRDEQASHADTDKSSDDGSGRRAPNGDAFQDKRQSNSPRKKTAPLGRTWLDTMKALSKTIIGHHGGELRPDMVREFFEERYATASEVGLDAKGLFRRLCSRELVETGFSVLDFEDYARDFRIIDDDGIPVFVPWGVEGRELLRALEAYCRAGNPPAAFAIKLQRSSVSIKRWQFEEYRKAGFIDAVTYEPLSVLNMGQDCESYYSDEVGLLEPGKEELHELIC